MLGKSVESFQGEGHTRFEGEDISCLASFQKRRSIFMSQHVNANLRVKLFNSTVLPVMLYGLSSLTLKPMHHSMLKGVQTKMLRNMAG